MHVCMHYVDMNFAEMRHCNIAPLQQPGFCHNNVTVDNTIKYVCMYVCLYMHSAYVRNIHYDTCYWFDPTKAVFLSSHSSASTSPPRQVEGLPKPTSRLLGASTKCLMIHTEDHKHSIANAHYIPPP